MGIRFKQSVLGCKRVCPVCKTKQRTSPKNLIAMHRVQDPVTKRWAVCTARVWSPYKSVYAGKLVCAVYHNARTNLYDVAYTRCLDRLKHTKLALVLLKNEAQAKKLKLYLPEAEPQNEPTAWMRMVIGQTPPCPVRFPKTTVLLVPLENELPTGNKSVTQ